jgi:SOS-response transcriptional repressor LexA
MPTHRQAECLRFISEFITKKGYSPSFTEIAGALGLSSLATVHKHVQGLIQEGYLTRPSSRTLSLVPTKLKENYQRCDAGHPIIFHNESQCPLCAQLRVNGFLREDLAKGRTEQVSAAVVVGSLEGGQKQRRKA